MGVSVLFIGGTGRISSACVARAVKVGLDVSVINRRRTEERPLPEDVLAVEADIRDLASVRSALGGREFSAVVDFVAFTPKHVQADIDLFSGRTGQYVFISSASAYQKPIGHLPITESTPLSNPFWQYSRDKIACEDLLVQAYRRDGFPVTIVRPSHTYDKTTVPFEGGWTIVERMRQHKAVIVHGDGTSLWVMTHHDDFARAFVPLLANPRSIGDTFHITSDEVLTWNQIYTTVAEAAGAPARLVHVASETIAKAFPAWGPSLLGDKSHSVLFDNAKIRRLVPDWTATTPFAEGAREIVAWHDADPSRRLLDSESDAAMDAFLGSFA